MKTSGNGFHIIGCERAIHEVRARLPFRYGNACLTAAPILHVRLEIAAADGRRARGLAADCLPPLWFDKDPGKSFRQNVEDQLLAVTRAGEIYLEGGQESRTAVEHWENALPRIHARCADDHLNRLTASFGSSFFERAMIDALCRLRGVPFFEALRADLLGFDTATDLPRAPRERVACRHTVGLADPLTSREIPPGERLDDGLPQALDEAIAEYGLRFFKVKVRGDDEADLDRLSRMAALFEERCAGGYAISLDGNEQYRDLARLENLLGALEERPAGRAFTDRIIYIEQPLSRDVALDPAVAAGVRALSRRKPVIIDESDDAVDCFERAVEVGYSGASHKNCKGIFKSLKNRSLLRRLNREAGAEKYFLTGEDLANVAVVPLQQDLTSLAALDIAHAERNGHHYFRGLDHLPAAEARAALAAHPDLYRERDGSVFLRLENGEIHCGSLQCAGYGYGCDIAFEERTPLEEWEFDF